jgi:hypothetical protein
MIEDMTNDSGMQRRADQDPIEAEFLPVTVEDLIDENPKKHERIRVTDPDEKEFISRIRKFRLIHCPTKDYKNARNLFVQTVAEINAGGEGALLAIYGSSQSGKSHILRQLRRHKMLQKVTTPEGIIRPLIMLEAPSPCTLKALGVAILEKLKFPDGRDSSLDGFLAKSSDPQTHFVWRQVQALLEAHGVSVLIIDEIHNVLVGKGKTELEETAMTIKSLLVNERWPMQVVISGTSEKTKTFIDTFPELQERVRRVEIQPIPRKDVKQLQHFVSSIEKQLAFPQPSHLDAGDMPDRFWLATKGHRGRVARLIFEAARFAHARGEASVTKKSLLDAVARRTTVPKGRNPFVVANPADCPVVPDDAWPAENELSSLKGKKKDSP